MTGVLKSRIHLPDLQGSLPALPLSATAVGNQVRKEFSRRLMLDTPWLRHVMTHIGTYTDFSMIFIQYSTLTGN